MRISTLVSTLAFILVPGSASAQLVLTETGTPTASPPPTYPAAPPASVHRSSIQPQLQDKGLQWLVQWNMAMPVLDTNTFNDDYSWRGISLDARYRVKPNISLGAASAWQVLSDKELVTETRGDATVTGVTIRHTNIVPILATVHYSIPLSFRDRTEAYAGLGLGTYYVERLFELGAVASESTKTWHFGFAPELGLMTPMGPRTFGTLSVRWNIALPGADEVPLQSYFNFNLGFLFL